MFPYLKLVNKENDAWPLTYMLTWSRQTPNVAFMTLIHQPMAIVNTQHIYSSYGILVSGKLWVSWNIRWCVYMKVWGCILPCLMCQDAWRKTYHYLMDGSFLKVSLNYNLTMIVLVDIISLSFFIYWRSSSWYIQNVYSVTIEAIYFLSLQITT